MKLIVYLKREQVTRLIGIRFPGKGSIKRFAVKLEVTQAYVYNMLNGKSSPSELTRNRIGQILGGRGVGWDDIFGLRECTTTSDA